MNKSVLARILLILLLLIWMIFIFAMSSQPAVQSSQTSGRFVYKIINIIYQNFEDFSAQQQENITHTITFIVRKTAHFLEYFALGTLLAGVAATYDKNFVIKFVAAQIVGVLYAVSDEVHQYFVPGRACRFLDVCIDSVGCMCAVVVIAVVILIHKRNKSGELNAKKEIN